VKRLIEVQRVHKHFPNSSNQQHRSKGLWRALRGTPLADPVAVLKYIDLHVDRGECVGLIGENGAGKSTLLKVLSGVLKPTRGKLKIHGSIAALLELGAGFHPDFSGRENIELSAQLMGIDYGLIKQQRNQIIEFADIGRYIDEPVKHYSSGMLVRLGFAIVSVLKPDLLMTDEILAVGDLSFQKKCIDWIDRYIHQGGSVLLTSHSMDQVSRLCDRVYWIHEGRMEMHGNSDEVINAYLAFHEKKAQTPDPNYRGGLYRIVEMTINQQSAKQPVEINNQQLEVHCVIHSPDDRPPVVAIGLRDSIGTAIYGTTSEIDDIKPTRLKNGLYEFTLIFEDLPLTPGSYRVNGHAMDPEALRLFDTVVREFIIPGTRAGPGFWHNSIHTKTD